MSVVIVGWAALIGFAAGVVGGVVLAEFAHRPKHRGLELPRAQVRR